MLCTTPSTSGAMVEMTGMRPAAMRSRTAPVLTWSTSPTRPMSVSTPSTVTPAPHRRQQLRILPVIPTADGPWALMRFTSSRPTWPNSTIRATSSTSGVVTRKPPLKSPGMPEPFEHRTDLRPAAVHHDRMNAAGAKEHHVGGKRGAERVIVGHRVTAVFDHNDLAVQQLQSWARPRQALPPPRPVVTPAMAVGRILFDVGVRQIRGSDGRASGSQPEVDRHLDIRTRQVDIACPSRTGTVDEDRGAVERHGDRSGSSGNGDAYRPPREHVPSWVRTEQCGLGPRLSRAMIRAAISASASKARRQR